MTELSPRARHLVQLLAEELDKTFESWTVLMDGDGRFGPDAWDWEIELGDGLGSETFISNAETQPGAKVISIFRVR